MEESKQVLWEKILEMWFGAFFIVLTMGGIVVIIVLTLFAYKGITQANFCQNNLNVSHNIYKINKYNEESK